MASQDSGIYKIICSASGRYYVGSSKRMFGYRGRFHNHLYRLRRGNHYNVHLQRAFNRHGESSFEFVVIESGIPEDQLLQAEQKYLDLANTERHKTYNSSFLAGRVDHTPEVRAKISRSKAGCKMSPEAVERARSRRHVHRGISHWAFNSTNYTFFNILTMRMFSGNQRMFELSCDVHSGHVSGLINGERISVGGWMLAAVEGNPVARRSVQRPPVSRSVSYRITYNAKTGRWVVGYKEYRMHPSFVSFEEAVDFRDNVELARLQYS